MRENAAKYADENYDVLVIGAGPGGLSAATAAASAMEQHAKAADIPADILEDIPADIPADIATNKTTGQAGFRVAVLERDEVPGGILNQCVHDGFGIVRYGAQLSGPEYGEIEAAKAVQAGVEILTGCMVTEIDAASGTEIDAENNLQVTVISRQGREILRAKSIVIATGCRERTRGMLSIPGTRPAGIFTAGVAQNLINRKNIMVGRRIVILGSGDIGLIMARRLTLEGAQVLCVAEVMTEPSGLARNVRQCLFDFDIPLYLSTTVSNIFGKGRLEALELSEVDDHLQPIPGTQRRVDCDTLILSVGLIPENEVAQTAGVALDPRTNGTLTDEFLQTSVPGIFACGNARAVMDLADFVSAQGEAAGRNAAAYALGQPLQKWTQDLHNVARKGLPEEGSVTCTLCPKGCQVKLEANGSVTGNSCPRGEAFAIQEMTDPHRILTTTMRMNDGLLIPVRSDKSVPFLEMQRLVKQLQNQEVILPPEGIRQGDILARGLGSEKVDIIAEATVD